MMRVALIAASLLLSATVQAADRRSWPFVGGDLSNTRSSNSEREIGPANAARLQPQWSTAVRGVQQETPVADASTLYVANGQGAIFWIDPKTGAIQREVDVAKLLELPGLAARGLGLSDTAVVFGMRGNPTVAAMDKNTGKLLWKTRIDDHPLAGITQPPLIHQGRVYIGVSGLGEEVQSTFPDYGEKCCKFRGSAVALDAASGKILWKTYTVPEGFSGGSVWSRMPALDPKRKALYITTGNLFRATPAVQACVDKTKAAKDRAALLACWPDNTWNDSIIALDMDTGVIKWGFRGDHVDIFTGACLRPDLGAFCGGGEDVDFGNGAILWRAKDKTGKTRDFVGAGQKSGTFWGLDADTGQVVWETNLGPAGPTGGILKGSASDGARIYAAEANSKQVFHFPKEQTLKSGQTIKYGSFAALESGTGEIVWQVPDPAGVKYPGNDKECKVDSPREACTGAFPRGPVTVANGVVYACSTAPDGPMYAFDSRDGKLLWTFNSGASCDSGAAVIDGTVYWVGGRTLHAFGVNKVSQ